MKQLLELISEILALVALLNGHYPTIWNSEMCFKAANTAFGSSKQTF